MYSARFEQQHVRRGPKDTRAYLIENLLVVRLTEVLTPAEVKLVKSASPEKGKDLLKESRAHLMKSSELTLAALIEEPTGVGVVSMHNDISTVTGEKIILFTLTESPTVREAKKRYVRQL